MDQHLSNDSMVTASEYCMQSAHLELVSTEGGGLGGYPPYLAVGGLGLWPKGVRARPLGLGGYNILYILFINPRP